MHWKYFKFIIYFFLIGFFAYYLESATEAAERQSIEQLAGSVPGSYHAKLYDIEQRRLGLQTAYYTQKAKSKIKTLQQSKNLIQDIITNEMFAHWLGTKYGFHGTTETPGKGKIACGYFVTTVLRDAGYPINRIKMAQAASEVMIKSLVDEENIHRFNRVSIRPFVRGVEDLGEGLFVVGLDTHTGFLYYDGVQLEFIHSTGFNPRQVIREKAITSRSLIKSKYKVVGKLTDDEDFVKRWITNVRQ